MKNLKYDRMNTMSKSVWIGLILAFIFHITILITRTDSLSIASLILGLEATLALIIIFYDKRSSR